MRYRYGMALMPLLAAFGTAGCATSGINNTDKGAMGGALAGAATGAVVAAVSSVHTGPGMAIGALAGAVVGAVIGGHMENSDLSAELEAMTMERDSLLAQLKACKDESAEDKAENARLNARIAELEAALAACNAKGGEVARYVIGNTVLFASGSAELSPAGMAMLDATAAEIRATHPATTVVVEGHTDNVPIGRSHWEDNWDLGAARARVVLSYLVTRAQMDGARMSVMSYAFHKPVATNDTAEGREQNRRTEIVVYSGR